MFLKEGKGVFRITVEVNFKISVLKRRKPLFQNRSKLYHKEKISKVPLKENKNKSAYYESPYRLNKAFEFLTIQKAICVSIFIPW